DLIDIRKKKLALEKALSEYTLLQIGNQISALEDEIEKNRKEFPGERHILGELVRALNATQNDGVSLALASESFSSFFDTVHNLELLHNSLREANQAMLERAHVLQEAKKDLEKKREGAVLLQELVLREDSAIREEDKKG